MSLLHCMVLFPYEPKPRAQEIQPALSAYQEILGGPIELLPAMLTGFLAQCGVDVYVNEEGKPPFGNLPTNVVLPDGQTVVGPLIFVGHDNVGGDVSLSDDQREAVMAWCDSVQRDLGAQIPLGLLEQRLYEEETVIDPDDVLPLVARLYRAVGADMPPELAERLEALREGEEGGE